MTSKQPVRWGVIGAGNMASKLCADLPFAPGHTLTVVASRDQARAQVFADRFGARAVSDYEALVAAADVDVVYVATTNPQHHAHALLAIEAGKAVVVEKPVALNAAQTRSIFEAAAARGVFAMEAMWMRINPLVLHMQDLVAEGAIGEVRSVRAEWGLGRQVPPGDRRSDPALGGGALLDIGIYNYVFAHMMMGRPDSITANGTLTTTGVDETVTVQWNWQDGREAELWTSVPVQAPGGAAIRGTEGWITPIGRFHRPSGLVVTRGDEQYEVPDPIEGMGLGFWPQVVEVGRCLEAGLIESPLINHADSLAIMELLDETRAMLGVVYPDE